MKLGILTLTAVSLMTTASYAARTEVKVIELSNAKVEETVTLKAEAYRTEYKSVWVSETCYNEVCSGTREVCDTTWEPSTCTDDRDCEIIDGTRHCSITPVCTGGGSSYNCYSVPDCYSEPYDCSHYDQVPYDVFDHNTEASVRVVLKDIAPGLSVSEKLKVVLNEDHVEVTSDVTKSNAVLLGTLTRSEVMSNGVKSVTAVITIKALPLADVVAPLSLVKISEVKDGLATIATKETKLPELFKLDLRVTEPKFLSHDPEHAKGSLTLADAKPVKAGVWQVDLSQIGLDWAKLPADKYKLSVKLGTALNISSILNRGVLPAKTSVEDVVKFKKK